MKAASEELRESRQELRAALEEVRRATSGLAPAGFRRWIVPLMVGTAAFVLAQRYRTRDRS